MKYVLTAVGCLLAPAALTLPAAAVAQNCSNPETAIFDSSKPTPVCVGDLIQASPPLVLRTINGSPAQVGGVTTWSSTGSTPVILDVDKFLGIPPLATFVYLTANCSGTPYLVVDITLPLSHAWSDWNKILWIADPSNYQTQWQFSHQFGGPYCYTGTSSIENIMPAIAVNHTLVSRLVRPLR